MYLFVYRISKVQCIFSLNESLCFTLIHNGATLINVNQIKGKKMNWNKQTIIKNIKECKMGVQMVSDILETVQEFEHYAKVNKRFIDKLKEKGYWAYIAKETYSTTLTISHSLEYNKYKCEFRYYISHLGDNISLTWDGIKEECKRHSFEERLKKARERLDVIDSEIIEFEEFINYIKSKKFKCFDSDNRVWDMENALKEAKEKQGS